MPATAQKVDMNNLDLGKVTVLDHPVIKDRLSKMRMESCTKKDFREHMRELAYLMAYEATRTLPIVHKPIQTPITGMDAPFLAGPEPVIVPILRAGLNMAEGLEDLLPEALIGHVGVYRDEKTTRPVEYLVRLPDLSGRSIFLLDPMLATGHSASYAIEVLLKNKAQPELITFVSIVSVREGISVIQENHPDVRMITASIDESLNEKAYIVPGLGDAGDRLFGTK